MNEQIKQNEGIVEFPQNSRYPSIGLLLAVVINALWRDPSCFTLVDHFSRIFNVFLDGSSRSSLQILPGHEV